MSEALLPNKRFLPFDIFPVIFHDDVDKVINGRYSLSAHIRRARQRLTILIADKHFAIQHLVIPQYVIEHLLIKVLGRTLECYFHASRFLLLQIDVTTL